MQEEPAAPEGRATIGNELQQKGLKEEKDLLEATQVLAVPGPSTGAFARLHEQVTGAVLGEAGIPLLPDAGARDRQSPNQNCRCRG